MANTKITSANLDTLTTLTVDDITIDGSTISDSGDLTLDVGGDIVLDAAGGDIILKNTGITNGNIVLGDATNPTVKITSDFDIIFDSASDITLDADGADIRLKDAGNTFGVLSSSGSDQFVLQAGTQDKDIIFKGNDGGSVITALTLDISDAGQAIFNAGASFEGGKLTINEFTSPSSFTQIRKTNTGSNLAIVSQESIYMLLDENNDQTNRSFFVEHGAGSPGTGTTLFKVQEDGNVDLQEGNLYLTGNNDRRIKLSDSGTAGISNSNDTVHIRGDNDFMKLNAAAGGGIIMEINGGEGFYLDSNHWIRLNGGNAQQYSDNQRTYSGSESITWSSSTSANTWTSSYYMTYQKFVEAGIHFGYVGNGAISQHFRISMMNHYSGLSVQTLHSASGGSGTSYHTITFTSGGAYNTRTLKIVNTPVGSQNTANLSGTIYYGLAI